MYSGVPTMRPVSVSRSPARRAGRERDAEVGDHGLALVQQDVLRLDVAVDHALQVRVMERGGDLPDDADRLVDRELPLAGEPLPQRLARDEGHDVVEQVAPAGARPSRGAAGCADG